MIVVCPPAVFFLKSVFLGKSPSCDHLPYIEPMSLSDDHLFFLTAHFFAPKGLFFLGKNSKLYGRWMIFTRPPAVEAEAMSLGTLALRLPRCTWICKHLYFWVLFFLNFFGNYVGILYLASTLHLDLQIFSY